MFVFCLCYVCLYIFDIFNSKSLHNIFLSKNLIMIRYFLELILQGVCLSNVNLQARSKLIELDVNIYLAKI